MEMVSEPENNLAMIIPRYNYDAIKKFYYGKRVPATIVLKENLAVIHQGLFFKAHSPFFEAFNEKIGWMVASGLIDFWNSYMTFKANIAELMNLRDDQGPQILTMDHLEVGFIASMIPLMIGIVVFIGEIIFFRLQSCFKKFMSKKCFIAIKQLATIIRDRN